MRISDWSSDVCSSDLFLMQLGSTRTRLWNEAEQAGLIRVCTVSNSLEPGFRSLIFCNKSINDLGNWRRIDDGADAVTTAPDRSEEHTSELQSLMRISYAVFCLKKNKNTYNTL